MQVKPSMKLVNEFWTNFSLRQKLSIVLVFMTLVPTVLTATLCLRTYEQAMRESVLERNENIAVYFTTEIDQMFLEKIRILKIIANNEEIRSMDPDRQYAVLREIVNQNPEIQLAVISDANGRQIARWDEKPADSRISYTDRQYFHTVMATGSTAISDVLVAKSTGKQGIVVAEPIKNHDQSINGVLIINIELQKIINRIEETRIGNTGYVYVVNKNGEITISPDRGLIENAADASYLPPVKAAISELAGYVEFDLDNQKTLACYNYAPNAKMGVIVQQPLEEAMADVNAAQKTSILVMGITALFAVLCGLAIASVVTKPIADITAAVNRLAKGDLMKPLMVASRDEIGQLADNFNDMLVKLARRDEALRESEEKYRSLVNNVNIGVYRCTNVVEDGFIQVNPAMAKIFGYDSITELMGVPRNTLCRNFEDWDNLYKDIMVKGFVKSREIAMCKKDGTLIWCSITGAVERDAKGNVKWVDGVVEDITERKRAEQALRQAYDELEIQVKHRTQELMALNEELHQISVSDGLTGIANRRYFDKYLEREWKRALREKTSLTLLMLDIDYFKLYNDTYGHLAGDECLKRIVELVKKVPKRGTDLFARYGGEEFAIVLPETDKNGALVMSEAIRAGVEKLEIEHKNSPIGDKVTVSIGVAFIVPSPNSTPSSVIIAADKALYQAKQDGRNRFRVADFIVS